jgi:deoxyribonuclease-4
MGLLGAHMSIAGGLHKAIERGEELGCEAIQIFTQSSRTWAMPETTGDEVRQFKAARKRAKKVKRVVAHNSYLLNLSTSQTAVRKKAVKYFIQAMERCEALGVESLITHPGSHLGAGEEIGLKMTSQSLKEVLKACPGFTTRILLENTAGQGDSVGCRFEQLARLIDGTGMPEQIGCCFDTQHAFASGYDLRTAKAYEKTMEEWHHLLSTSRIEAFHLNDTMKDIGCRVDRHQNIGKGFLGAEAFRPLVNDPKFKDVPMCLETAPGDDMSNWREELALLRSLQTSRR